MRTLSTTFLLPSMLTSPPPFSPSLISLVVSVDVKHHVFTSLHTHPPPFSPSLISLVVSVDVKHHVYFTRCGRHMAVPLTFTQSGCVTNMSNCFSSNCFNPRRAFPRGRNSKSSTTIFIDGEKKRGHRHAIRSTFGRVCYEGNGVEPLLRHSRVGARMAFPEHVHIILTLLGLNWTEQSVYRVFWGFLFFPRP